jgi:hypothetical protein
MNQIEPINDLPDWEWQPNSEREIKLNGIDLVQSSDFVWRVGNVASVGFIYHSYTSPPWMWFALVKNIGIKDLVDFRRLARMIPKGTLTAVGTDFALGLRFAKLYEFEEIGEELTHLDRTYQVMRKM